MSALVSTPPAPVPVIPVDMVVNCVVNEPEKLETFVDESVAVPNTPSVAVTPELVFCNCSGSPLNTTQVVNRVVEQLDPGSVPKPVRFTLIAIAVPVLFSICMKFVIGIGVARLKSLMKTSELSGGVPPVELSVVPPPTWDCAQVKPAGMNCPAVAVVSHPQLMEVPVAVASPPPDVMFRLPMTVADAAVTKKNTAIADTIATFKIRFILTPPTSSLGYLL